METDEILKRIFDKLEKFDDKLDDLCNRMTKMESQMDNHLDEIEKSRESREKKFYVIMALMGAGFTIFEIAKSFH